MNGADIVCARLLAITAITTLVSTRIYALLLPQNSAMPAIRVTLVPGGPDPMHLRGLLGVSIDRVQVDAYADLESADPLGTARSVADAAYGEMSGGVATGLAGWAGSIGSPATKVDLIEPAAAPIETYAPDEYRQAIVTQDYYVHYRT